MTTSSPLYSVHPSSCQSIQNPNRPLTLFAVHRRRRWIHLYCLCLLSFCICKIPSIQQTHWFFSSWFCKSNHKLHFKYSREHKQIYILQINPYFLLTFTTSLSCHSTEDPAKWSCSTILLNLNCISSLKHHVRDHPHPLTFHSKTTNVIVNQLLSKWSGLEKSLSIIKVFKITLMFLTELG